MRVLPINNDESIVKTARVDDLVRKERAHDAYMSATHTMRMRMIEVRDKLADATDNGATGKAEWCAGYIAAMREFAEAVVRA